MKVPSMNIRMNKTLKLSAVAMLTLSIGLFALNFYGLTQSLRPDGLTADVLRFGEADVTIDTHQLLLQVKRKDTENDLEYATRITYALAAGVAHIDWNQHPPEKFHQRVPAWENFILWAMSYVTNIPEYERYHFSDPYRSIERGIGICGDASMTLSGLLDEQHIPNKIVTLPGHVMVEAYINNKTYILDGDYGVVLEDSFEHYQQYPEELITGFRNQLVRSGDGEEMIANNLSTLGFKRWNGTKHFITNKYYFEKLAYPLKWALPSLLLIIGFTLLHASKRRAK